MREYPGSISGLLELMRKANIAEDVSLDTVIIASAITLCAERIEALVDAVDQQTEVMRPVEYTTTGGGDTKETLSKADLKAIAEIQRIKR